MQKIIIPVILTIALIFSGILSVFSIFNIQGNARVINYAGVVRGASQRLVKQELNQMQNEELVHTIDAVIDELKTGEGENDLIRLNSAEFQDLMTQMQAEWNKLKEEIYLVRSGADGQALYVASEAFFVLADRTVTAAEQHTENNVIQTTKLLSVLTCSFILFAFILMLYFSRQNKRQKRLQEAEEANREKSKYLKRMSQDLRAPMNDISELMYVSDVENYEMLFINDAGKKTFQIDSLNGEKCYELLHKKTSPCEFCTTSALREGEIYTWEHTNSYINRHYLLKDRLVEWEGHHARMEIAFDMTEAEKEKERLKNTLDSEKMITECVRTLYKEHDLGKAMDQVLCQLGSFLSAERAYIFNVREQLMYNENEWCADGIEPQKDKLQKISLSSIERWMPAFDRQECVVIENLESIRESSPEEYSILHQQSITSMVVAPLERDGRLAGYLGVDNPPPDKLINIASLLQTLCYFIMLAYRHAESQQQLSHLSYFDVLTSFYNRNRYIEDSRRLTHMDTSVGVVYLDVNGLKDINDQYGHAFGDKVLAECARRMKVVFKGADFYRIGGDEFVIICKGIGKELFDQRIRELKNNFEEDPLYHAAVGACWAEKVDDLSRIIADADAKMYEDKKNYYRNHPASNRYRHYSDELLHLKDPEVLKNEIQKNRFVVYLQPKVSSNRMVVGAEALIRYRSQFDTIVLPGNFLPVLEESHSISLIDFFVFEFVCTKLQSWLDTGKKIFPVSVNFSRSSLCLPSFVEQLKAICNNYHIPPQYLEIEITEGIRDAEGMDIRNLISEIRKAGFVVAIDDFGTEYANLSLLSSVEFDVLKLDKSMIDDISKNPKTKAVVTSIAEICTKLGVDMIAEGIETEEQLSALQSCGVTLGQGFLFSKPIPALEYEEKYVK